MKSNTFIGWVITADQHHSRDDVDRVPAALGVLADVPARLPFERTAGDEVQGLLDDADAVVAAVLALTRLGWHIGVGAGPVETPLPASTRAARGEAYVRAREAVEAAKGEPSGVDVRGAGEDAATAFVLLCTLAGQRTENGWEVADLLASMSGRDAAARLGISPSAVSQRAARAHVTEVRRASVLAARLLAHGTEAS